jgi:uncharacterized iron-regulated protein
MSRRRPPPPALLLLPALLLSSACALVPVAGTPTARADHRIFDTAAGRQISLAELGASVGGADVVFFGELHDDAVAHRLQVELLDILAARRFPGVLGLEMFERDVQPVIDRYLSGELSEAGFLAAARPWANYRTDYRPLVELARRRGWAVAGTNLPQPLATAVGREGLAALEALPAAVRAMAAANLDCPRDAYWDRFVEAMSTTSGSAGHSAHTAHAASEVMLNRLYEAQCARDETMAETVAAAVADAFVFHVNGSFHTDYHLGIVPRLQQRAPGATVRVISALPVGNLSAAPSAADLARADYLILTRRVAAGR